MSKSHYLGSNNLLYTDEWVISSSKNPAENFQNVLSQGFEGQEYALMSMGSEKSQTEYHLREENMFLRQEILKLKKALFMNNSNNNSNQKANDEFSIPTSVAQTPYNIHDLNGMNLGDEPEPVLANPPKPYEVKPQKPVSNSTMTSQMNLFQLSSPEPPVVNQTLQEALPYKFGFANENSTNHVIRMKQLQTLFSHDSNQMRREALSLLLQSQTSNDPTLQHLRIKAPSPLALPSHHQHHLSSSSRVVIEESQKQNEYDDDDSDALEKYLKEESIHVRECFLEDTSIGFDERKRKSSVFEEKRHYELEIEQLKRDLQMIQQEEEKIKSRLQKQNLPFTPKGQEGTKKVFRRDEEQTMKEKVAQINQTHEEFSTFQQKAIVIAQESNKITRDSQLQRASSTAIIANSSNKHQRFKSIDLLKNQLTLVDQQNPINWQPPSFCNSHMNSLKNSASREGKRFQRNHSRGQQTLLPNVHPVETSNIEESSIQINDTQLNNSECYDKHLDTEIIDKIFEDRHIQQQFQCLDQSSRVVDDSSLLIENNQFLPDDTFNDNLKQLNDTKEQLRSFNDNSFCQFNYKSEQSSVAIVRAQEKVRQEQTKDNQVSFNFKNSLNSINNSLKGYQQQQQQEQQLKQSQSQFYIGEGNKICIESPPKPIQSAPRHNCNIGSKDYSPSFGGDFKKRNIYETCESILSKQQTPTKVNSICKVPTEEDKREQKPYKCCHTKQQSSIIMIKDSMTQQTSKSRQGSNSRTTSKTKIYSTTNAHTAVTSNHQTAKPSISSTSQAIIGQYQAHINRLSKIVKGISKEKQKRESLDFKSQKLPDTNKRQSFLKPKQDQFTTKHNLIMQPSKSVLALDRSLSKSKPSLLKDKLLQGKSQRTTPSKQIKNLNSRPISCINEPEKICSTRQPLQQFPIFQNEGNQSCMLDAELLYDLRNKSALKKREELIKRKEDKNRQKLNEKMARINKLQKKKEDQRNTIIERRYSKSPCGGEYQSNMLSSNHSQSVINYCSIPTTRTPQPSTPLGKETRNTYNQLGNSVFFTLFNQTNTESGSFIHFNDRSQDNSRSCSKAHTPEVTTPLSSTRRIYGNSNSQLGFQKQTKSSQNLVTTHKSFLHGNQSQINRYQIVNKQKSNTAQLFKKHQQSKLSHNQSALIYKENKIISRDLAYNTSLSKLNSSYSTNLNSSMLDTSKSQTHGGDLLMRYCSELNPQKTTREIKKPSGVCSRKHKLEPIFEDI